MHNELTEKDIQLMRQELDYRRTVLRPKIGRASCRERVSSAV